MHGLGELNTYFMMPNEQFLLHWNYQKWHQKLHLDDLRSHKAVFQETLRLFQQLTWGNDITTSVGTTSLEACLSGNAAAGWWLLGCIPCLWSLRRWWCHPQLHCPGPCWCQPRSLQLDGPQLVRHMGFHMLQRFLATSGYNINRDMSDMIITNCKIMQASNLVVLEQKAKLYDSMMSQCVSVITNPCEVHFSQVAFWGTMFNFFITVAPSLVMVVPLPSSINLSIPRGPKVDLTMPTTW